MRRLFIPALVSIIALSGCMDDRTSQTPAAPAPAQAAAAATPGSYQNGGGTFTPFYGEEVHDNRLYVFGTKSVWEKFQQTKDMDPLNSRRLIGKGPNKMTLILETTKDEPAKDKRILKTVAERYNLTL